MPFNPESKTLTVDRRGSTRVLLEEVRHTDSKTKRKTVVPKGFPTDFASIPNGFKWLVNNDDGRIIRPAIIHDYNRRTLCISARLADAIFYRALREEGVSIFKARLMYYAVRSHAIYNRLDQ